MYNALLGGVDLEGKNFYYTNPLINTERAQWHVCPCCVGNIPRTLLMIPTWTYAKDNTGLRQHVRRQQDPSWARLQTAGCLATVRIALVAGLYDHDYTTNQMTYDLRRLRLHGLIERIPRLRHPHRRRHPRRSVLPKGPRPRPSPLDHRADQPPAPIELRHAISTIDRIIQNYATNARLGTAA